MARETHVTKTGSLEAATRSAFIAVLLGIGLVEALDRFGASPALAAFFPLLPLAIAMIFAVRARSLTFDDVVRGGAIGGAPAAFAFAGAVLSSLVLSAGPVAMALGGRQGAALVAVLIVGVGLALYRVAPDLSSTGEATPAAAIGKRFGRAARPTAALAVIAALLPMLAAEADLAGRLAERMLGLSAPAAGTLLVGLAAIAGLFGGARSALVMAATLAPVVVLAYFTPATIAAFDAGLLPTPFAGLFDARALEAATRIPTPIVAALALSLFAGAATLPSLLLPATSATPTAIRHRDRALGLGLVVAVLATAPSYVLFGRLYGVDATTNPAGLIGDFASVAGLSAAPAVLLIGGVFVATLVTLSIGLTAASAALANDLLGNLLDGGAGKGGRVFIARLGMVIGAATILWIGQHSQGGVAMLGGIGLSIAAAALGPLLLLGWRRQSVGELSAAGAIAIGLAFIAANIGLAMFQPAFAGRHLGMGVVTPTILGPTGWFGLPVGLSGGPGVLVGLLALVLLAMLERALHRRATPPAPPGTIDGGPDRITGPPPPLQLPPPDEMPGEQRLSAI